MTSRFVEVQKFTDNWIAKLSMIVLVPIVLSVAWKGVEMFRYGAPRGAYVGGAIGGVVFLAVGYLIFFGRLTTEVKDGLYVRLYPLTGRHRFGFAEIKECKARSYRPIMEYGGWGVRFSRRHGKAYNVSGDRGVQLLFKNGNRLLIGSLRSNELEAAIREAARAAGHEVAS